jgi:diguanylate cyclase (GGDEF)-like protein
MAKIRALVIDDDQTTHEVVRAALEPRIVDEIVSAHLPGDGIRSALDARPDLILLDINMPEMDGFKVCRMLKENESTRDVPILFLTVEANVVHLARALDCGATDYIRKPVNEIELQARVRVALRDQQLVRTLKEQARIDALTSLSNRAALDDALAAAASAHKRMGTPASLLMIDVDRFKGINDTYGHGVGDEVLRAIGQAVARTCRPYDSPCRFGGDEFAVVFGQVEGEDAHSATNRLLVGLREIEVRAGDAPVDFTVSAGLVTSFDSDGLFEPDELLKAADVALYAAKANGRDRLVVGRLRPGTLS